MPVDDFPEVAVVLGGGFSGDGKPTASTHARARAAAQLARHRPDLAVILSGSHGSGPAPERSEAAVMAEAIEAAGIGRDRLFLEERSRETLGNGVEVAVTISIGGAFAPQWVRSSAPLWIERADQQLYRAKAEGRNRACLEQPAVSQVSVEEKSMLFGHSQFFD